MTGALGFMSLVGTGLVTVYLAGQVWASKRAISCMLGMMLAMVAGMMVGLTVGVAAAALLGGPLWPPTLVGMVSGIIVGAILGAPVSPMAVLDGALSGLMGGMMGAMLGGMAPESVPEALGFLLITYAIAAVILTRILRQQAGAKITGLHPIEVSLLVLAIFFVGLFFSPSCGSIIRSESTKSPSAIQEAVGHQGHRLRSC